MERMFESIEGSLEVFTAAISLVILFLGVTVLKQLRFSLQKQAVRFFLAGVILFAVTELTDIVNGLLNWEALDIFKELAETGFIVSIAIALFYLYQSDRREISSLQDTAFTDALTGVANRRHFDQLLVDELERASRFVGAEVPRRRDRLGKRPRPVDAPTDLLEQHLQRVTDRVGLVARVGAQHRLAGDA